MDLSQEIRVKVDEETHRLMHAFAHVDGTEVSALVRHVLSDYIAERVRRHKMESRALRGEGVMSE